MRQFAKPILTLAMLLLAATAALGQQSAPAPAARSSWECLPPETVLLMRAPSGKVFLDALRKQTKFGAVGLSPERLDKFAIMLQEESKTEWEKFGQDLAKYNLKPQDWNDLFVGEAGFGLAIAPRPGKSPVAVGLSWVEPGGDLSDRLIKALEKSIEDEKGKPGTPRRVDSTIEGFKVMRLTTALMGSKSGARSPQFPPNFGQMTPEERTEWFKKQREAQAAEPQVQVDQTQVFISRLGNRILVGTTFPQSDAEVRALVGAGQKVDFDAVTGVEQATAIYARFLAAHNAKAGEGVAAALLATPGLAAAMPAGTTGFELLADPRPLIKLVDPKTNAEAARFIKAMGFDTVGPAGARLTLDGSVIRTGAFLSVPAPRSGLITLFDQPGLPATPPAWVPANLLSYSQLSFDLGKAYSRVKELVLAEWGPQAQPGFDQAEMQVKTMLQVDLPVLLSSLGSRHSFLTYGPLSKPAAAGEGDAKAPAGPDPNAENRMAFVWQLQDEALWTRVMGTLAPFAGMAPVQEQGFTGLRIPAPRMETGVFIGKGFMTVGLGKGVVESTLAWLRTPPQGEAAMAGSPIFQRGKALLALEPSMMFQVSDAGRSMRMVREAVIATVEQAATRRGSARRRVDGRGPAAPRLFLKAQAAEGEDGENHDDADEAEGAPDPEVDPADAAHGKSVAARLRALLPTDAEMEGMFGASVQQIVVKPQGVVAQSALELPPAGK